MDERNIFSHYERKTFLRGVNPAIKLLVSLLYMLAVTAVFDLRLIGLWSACAAALLLAGAGMRPMRILKGVLPFLLIGLGFLWAHTLFPATGGSSDELVFSWGFLRIYRGPFLFGLTMAFRAGAFGLFSLVFAATTDPMDLAVSLMRQFHLSARAAFSVLAAHRFLLMLERDLSLIRDAHRLRGLGAGKGLAGRWTRFRRYTLPLFAGIIRKAGRTAMAMEARGLGTAPRTFLRDMRIKGRDILYAGAALTCLLGTILFARAAGWIRLWSGAV